MQDKKPKNSEGQAHGLWERYYDNGEIWWTGLFINNRRYGKHTSYRDNGTAYFIENFINDEYHGYYEYQYVNGNIDKKYYAR